MRTGSEHVDPEMLDGYIGDDVAPGRHVFAELDTGCGMDVARRSGAGGGCYDEISWPAHACF